MSVKSRLIFLFFSLCLLIIIGRWVTDSFAFLLTQFWFTAGFFLLLLLSLIDQPHFSKDANIFVNATTAWVSLLLVTENDRDGVWWGFFLWAMYLIVSSYVIMWSRSRELQREPVALQAISRVNRQIGRPEALFSAFFLWGCVHQFGVTSPKLSPLFLFWACFMILNLPALSGILDSLLSRRKIPEAQNAGVLLHIVSPSIAEVSLAPNLSSEIAGRVIHFRNTKEELLAEGVLVDDRIVSGKRLGRVAITKTEKLWTTVGTDGAEVVRLDIGGDTCAVDDLPISVVDVGTEIGKLVFHVHPAMSLQSGEVLWVNTSPTTKSFYQIISAVICQTPAPDGNSIQSVRVTAGQLGSWDDKRCHFEPITWVAPAGHLIHRATASTRREHVIPQGNEIVGGIPNSDFPVHVSIEDTITHNTAIIGVTGSGKSYLAFHLIEAMVRYHIKVLILDLSRQHDLYLTHHNPTALKAASDISAWLKSESFIGIHQYANDAEGYPRITADFVAAAFAELSKAKLERGKNIPARLCVVFEEAHSLIPEWNQVAQPSDTPQVNRTARTILQGRKYGMGALIITQRTANVTKTILNQCNTIFALQSFDQTGLDFLRNYMGEEYSQAISTLPMRHAILVGKASSSTRPLLFSVADLSERWKDHEAEEPAGSAAIDAAKMKPVDATTEGKA